MSSGHICHQYTLENYSLNLSNVNKIVIVYISLHDNSDPCSLKQLVF